MIYRAGIMIAGEPKQVPRGLHYEKFKGGKYMRFILTGPYEQLPEACGRVFEIIEQRKIQLRDDFFIEHYVNDPRVTPEKKVITEILMPTL